MSKFKKIWEFVNRPLHIQKQHVSSYRSFGGGGGSANCYCDKGENHEV